MNAKAYADNDVVIIVWHYDRKIDNCLGFCVERIDKSDNSVHILPAWVGFEGHDNKDWTKKNTSIWPIQKYNWKDFSAQWGKNYKYRISPMIGTPGALSKITDNTLILETNEISLSEGVGKSKTFFNQGILSTQPVSHEIGSITGGTLSGATLLDQIKTPGNQQQKDLTGELKDAVISLFKKAKTEGGKCYCALYELTDEELIQNIINTKERIELILAHAGGVRDVDRTQTKAIDLTNKDARTRLEKEGVIKYDRFVPRNHTGHDQFVVYVNDAGSSQFVLTGSTIWTANGLRTQSDNAILIESQEIARYYYDFWHRMKKDTIVDLDNDPKTPSDLKEIFELISGAKKSIQFLVFQPGLPGILDKILKVYKNNKKLYVRGAATDADAVRNIDTKLHHGDSDQPGLYDVVPAANIKDLFSYWARELLSAGHAVIHDKIVVIDAFTDKCIVITGSHNLGHKASNDNDENLLIIKGNRELAKAYAAHVMDVYEHYRWLYALPLKGKNDQGNFIAFSSLTTTDAWQDKYFIQNPAPGD